jgi:EAL domain-containing protein (putative c-di-GMP-specific phosphodiesterase class I)/GGDEF domain-containing protein
MASTDLPLASRSRHVQAREEAEVGPRRGQGLQFKLLLAMLVSAAVLAAGTSWLTMQRIDNGLAAATLQLEQATHDRLANGLADAAARAQTLALTLASLQTEPRLPEAALRSLVPTLVDRIPQSALIAAIGLWPEPAGANASRNSDFWVRDAHGTLTAHDDYNDPRTIPYFREAWYTPARYADPGRCYWTPVYQELVSKRQVVTCAMRLTGARGFEGVATVSLDLQVLSSLFADATADERGYALLLDRDGRLLALSARAQKAFGGLLASGRSIAELQQRQSDFGALVLALHRRGDDFLTAALHAPRYDARSISTLRDNTRELARADADSALASIWNPQPGAPETLRQPDDPVLGEASYAVISELPDLRWQLASVTPARDGAALVRAIALHTLLLTGISILLWLLLVSGVVHWVVIRPLRRIAATLARAEQLDDPLDVTLDASGRDEIGSIAHWLNERTRQLRDRNDRVHVDRSQLAMEMAERQRALETLARLDNRSVQTLANIDDGVIYTDERGIIDSINAAAQRMVSLDVGLLRGRPLSEALPLRLLGDPDDALPNLVELVISRGTRIDYAGGILLGEGPSAQELRLAAVPLTARNGRRIGCVLVFRPFNTAVAAGIAPHSLPAATAVSVVDPVTGLGDRLACERLLKTHPERVLLVVEISGIADIIEAGGHRSGDEALRQIGERLAAQAGGSERIFRLPGEYFAVVPADDDPALAEAFAARVRTDLGSLLLTVANRLSGIDARIGIDAPSEVAAGPAERLRRASVAARAARQVGKGIEHWQPSFDPVVKTLDDSVWVERIRAGLDHDLFHLTTQAIIPSPAIAQEGEVFEMLLTLEDEEGFWAPPAAFLPVAARHGLDTELDRWVIRRTLETARTQPGRWQQLAFVGINLSAAAFGDGAVLDFLAEQLQELPPALVGKLCFELREDRIDEQFQQALRFCETMRALGCRVAIDQFKGRGNGDLTILRKLPASLIKLDTRAYRSIADDELAQMQAQSQLRMIHHLGKRAIVTGIDDERNAAVWRKLGADYLQGYALARPSPMMFSR